MKTDPLTACAGCEASYSSVALGRREYFIPWGSYFLCDKCHRFAIMEAFLTKEKPSLEPAKSYKDTR